MNTLLYWLGRAVIGCVQALPLTFVARVGRCLGALAWLVDIKHRRVVVKNLNLVFHTEKSAEEIRAIARECFRRIGENMACSVKTAAMTRAELQPHLELVLGGFAPAPNADGTKPNYIFAAGHFGNFEIYARTHGIFPDYQLATTYRAMKQPGLNRLVQEMRQRSGCRFFERRTEGAELRAAMNQGGLFLGLLGDQYARGLRAPFFGHICDTGLAPAVLALRYDCRLYTVICYRTALASWRLEFDDQIATHENGQPRRAEDIILDVNRAYEKAIRRDPANWFWVHDRWKVRRLRRLVPE